MMKIPKNYSDIIIQSIYKLLYRLKLLYNYFINPSASGVYVAVWYGNKILLIKNSYKSIYTFPCGGVKNNETSIDAAIRELQEEVSISSTTSKLSFYNSYINETEYMIDYINLYELNINNPEEVVMDNREVIETHFLTIEDALNKPLFPVVQKYLLKKL